MIVFSCDICRTPVPKRNLNKIEVTVDTGDGYGNLIRYENICPGCMTMIDEFISVLSNNTGCGLTHEQKPPTLVRVKKG